MKKGEKQIRRPHHEYETVRDKERSPIHFKSRGKSRGKSKSKSKCTNKNKSGREVLKISN